MVFVSMSMIEIDILPASSENKGGDSALIRIGQFNYSQSPNQQFVILIDGGYKENTTRIKDYLTSHYQTNTIDLAIITHPDMDHISGFVDILTDTDIKIKSTRIHDPWNHTTHIFNKTIDGRRTINSLNNKFEDTLKQLSSVLDNLGSKNKEPFPIGKVIDHVNLYILGPDKKYYRELLYKFPGMEGENTNNSIPTNIYEDKTVDYTEELNHFLDSPQTSAKNNSSIITLLHDYSNQPVALFTGDAGVEAIEKALDYADNNYLTYKGVYLFQIPHHGSNKNINENIIKRIMPRNVYVSAPANSEKHPCPLAINYLIKEGLNVYHVQNKEGILFPFNCQISRAGWSDAKQATIKEKVFPIRSSLTILTNILKRFK